VASSEDRRVAVHLEGDRDRLVVVVEDSGPGLSTEQVTHALERGWSTKAGTDDAGRGPGRGLGLALVAQVARRRHGGVDIDRSSLGGARLTVTLGQAAREPEPVP
jgi:two-component system, CitB family, sensor kinase